MPLANVTSSSRCPTTDASDPQNGHAVWLVVNKTPQPPQLLLPPRLLQRLLLTRPSVFAAHTPLLPQVPRHDRVNWRAGKRSGCGTRGRMRAADVGGLGRAEGTIRVAVVAAVTTLEGTSCCYHIRGLKCCVDAQLASHQQLGSQCFRVYCGNERRHIQKRRRQRPK